MRLCIYINKVFTYIHVNMCYLISLFVIFFLLVQLSIIYLYCCLSKYFEDTLSFDLEWSSLY